MNEQEKASIYEKIFQLKNAGHSVNQIALQLNASGIKTVTGCAFTPQNVDWILKRNRKRFSVPATSQTEMKYEPGFAKFILFSSELDDAKKISILKLFF